MLQSLELFLIAAEELNFSKAAQKAYVTQQCLSDHIKRLERQYGAPLFYRKPRLALTEYGIVLQKAVQNMKLIETNLDNQFREISGEKRGTFTFGINATRARVLFPRIYPKFHQQFPFINLNIRLNETRSMESLLLNGKLDMFLGVDTIIQPLLHAETICSNPLYCVLSRDTFSYMFGPETNAKFKIFREGIDLALFQEIPFLLCLPESTTRQMIETSLSRQNIYLKNTISISDYETHFDLCAHHHMVTACPSIAIGQAIHLNRTLSPKNQLLIFPIRNFSKDLYVYLVYHKDLYITSYMKYFIELLTEEIIRQNFSAVQYLDLQFSTELL